MWTGAAGIWTSNTQIIGQPALPTEPQPPHCLCFLAKRSTWPRTQLWHHFTCHAILIIYLLSYISTTHFSKAWRSLSLTAEMHSLSVANVFETSSQASHVFHGRMTQCHNHWWHGRRGYQVVSLVLRQIHLVFSPLPKVTHIFTWSHQSKQHMVPWLCQPKLLLHHSVLLNNYFGALSVQHHDSLTNPNPHLITPHPLIFDKCYGC